MSATIEISEEVAEQVRELVQSGAYPNSDSAVREAIRLLREQLIRHELWTKLEKANEHIERGQYYEWNEETRQRIIREGHAKFERGDPINPDVCP
jgi:Arc/MetJ-type ribon-helix-helix transcriptional regulator